MFPRARHWVVCFIIFISCACVEASNKQKMIYVYNDKGVSQDSLSETLNTLNVFLGDRYRISTLNARQIKTGRWRSKAALLVMPGGADRFYVQKLQGAGNTQIKAYVHAGGKYWGICAGAYYAASQVEFDKGGPLEVLGSRGLKFFQGTAQGPILARYAYHVNSGARAACVNTHFEGVPKACVYYNGGSAFFAYPNFHAYTVWARYADNGLPAVVSLPIGKGRALLSGIHAEYSPHHLNAKDPFLARLKPTLLANNKNRKALLQGFFKVLAL